MKASAKAHSNAAFVKYWGKKKGEGILKLPVNGSISMNLSALTTTTTVKFSESYKKNIFIFNGKKADGTTSRKVSDHLENIKKLANVSIKAKVVSENNFPHSTGLSSSASGFAALTVAASQALGLHLKEKELSILARLGSGSACRSIPPGFVEWKKGKDHKTSYAYTIYPPDYWDLIDIVVIVNSKEKELSSTEGMARAFTSPFFKKRISTIEDKITVCKEAIKKKDIEQFGKLIESEALEMHSIAITSQPPILYWAPETVHIMQYASMWRKKGIPVYFTINTGHDVHLISTSKNKNRLAKLIKELNFVKKYYINNPSDGAHSISKHLF